MLPVISLSQVTQFMGRYDVSQVDVVNDTTWLLTGEFVDLTWSWTGEDAAIGDKILQRGTDVNGKMVFDRYKVVQIMLQTTTVLNVRVRSDYSTGVQNSGGMPSTGAFPIAKAFDATMTFRTSFYLNQIDPDYDAALDNLNLGGSGGSVNNDSLAWYHNGTKTYLRYANDKVSIGTNVSSTKLHLNGSLSFKPVVFDSADIDATGIFSDSLKELILYNDTHDCWYNWTHNDGSQIKAGNEGQIVTLASINTGRLFLRNNNEAGDTVIAFAMRNGSSITIQYHNSIWTEIARNDFDTVSYVGKELSGEFWRIPDSTYILLSQMKAAKTYALKGHVHTLAQLTDVDTTGKAIGKVLGFNGSIWVPVNQTGGGGGSGTGQNNIGENIGTNGVGVYSGKRDTILQFYKINGASPVGTTLNGTTHDIDIIIDTTKVVLFNDTLDNGGRIETKHHATSLRITPISTTSPVIGGTITSGPMTIAIDPDSLRSFARRKDTANIFLSKIRAQHEYQPLIVPGTPGTFYSWDKTWRTVSGSNYLAGYRMNLTGSTFNNASYQKVIDTVRTTMTGLLGATSGVLYRITDNSAYWNTSYGWGDHHGLYVPLARTITINGVTQDLSSNRSWTTGSVSSITAIAPLTGGLITTTGNIGITLATTASNGYLSSTDWNTFNSKMNNPTTTTGDIVYRNSFGVISRLGLGSVNQVLTVYGGLPAWRNSATGFVNPMTQAGDIIFNYSDEPGLYVPARLGIGTVGQVLTAATGQPTWADLPAGSSHDPLTVKTTASNITVDINQYLRMADAARDSSGYLKNTDWIRFDNKVGMNGTFAAGQVPKYSSDTSLIGSTMKEVSDTVKFSGNQRVKGTIEVTSSDTLINQRSTGTIVKFVVGTGGVSFGTLVYISTYSGNTAVRAASSTDGTKIAIGMALESKAAGLMCRVLLVGLVKNNSWSSSPYLLGYYIGKPVYLQTDGTITPIAPSASGNSVQIVGMVSSSTSIVFNPQYVTVILK